MRSKTQVTDWTGSLADLITSSVYPALTLSELLNKMQYNSTKGARDPQKSFLFDSHRPINLGPDLHHNSTNADSGHEGVLCAGLMKLQR